MTGTTFYAFVSPTVPGSQEVPQEMLLQKKKSLPNKEISPKITRL
jgi:hypothetical protein